MNFMKRLEPKVSTLIQAVVITFVLVLISFVFENEEKIANTDKRTVASRGF